MNIAALQNVILASKCRTIAEWPMQTALSVYLETKTARLLRSLLTVCQVISPRNHMVFTPLLASTCVGTLEPRSVALPLTDIQPQLKQPQV